MNAAEKMVLEQLEKEKVSLQKEKISLQQKISSLEERIAWFERQVFGKRSERIVKNLDESHVLYLPGFEEWCKKQEDKEVQIEKQQVAAHSRRIHNKGKDTITFPKDLPVKRIELDLPEEQKVCSETGLPLIKVGEEVSRKLAHIPGSYFVKEYVRPVYALPKESEGGIRTAGLPDSIIPKCRVDESLLADVIVKKYADHLPLYRVSEAMAREGIQISRQLLSQWVVRIGNTLTPLYDLLKEKILESGNVFADETPVSMQAKGRGKVHQAYMWTLSGGKERDPSNRIYLFRTNRRHKNIEDLLGGYSGVLHSDKYGAYEKLAAGKQITWCPCFAHIRRKFFEAESGDPKFRDWCLAKIRYLFLFERVAWNRSPEERLKIRQEKEVPIIDELIRGVKERLVNGKLLPKCKLRQALGYLYGLAPYLKNYTKNAWARLDNNVAERAVRPLTLGRKNWLFVGNENGGQAAAVLLSLVQTCRALKINPRDYLEDVLKRFMGHPFNRLEELLPENWAKASHLFSMPAHN